MRSGGQWKENLPVWIWYLRSGKIQLGVTDMKWRRDLRKALMTDIAVYTTGPDATRNINLGGGFTTCKQRRNRERGQKTYRHQTLWLLLHCKLLLICFSRCFTYLELHWLVELYFQDVSHLGFGVTNGGSRRKTWGRNPKNWFSPRLHHKRSKSQIPNNWWLN